MTAIFKKLTYVLSFILILSAVTLWAAFTDRTFKSALLIFECALAPFFLCLACLWNDAAIISLRPIKRRRNAAAIFTVSGFALIILGLIALLIKKTLFPSELLGIGIGLGFAGLLYSHECEE